MGSVGFIGVRLVAVWVWRGSFRHGRQGEFRLVEASPDMARRGRAGMFRSGSGCHGGAWQNSVWFGRRG